MSLDDDDVALGPAVFTESPDSCSNDDVAAPLPAELAGASRGVAERRTRDVPCSGGFGAWLLRKPGAREVFEPWRAVALVACRWVVEPASDELAECHAQLHPGSTLRSRQVWGYLRYFGDKVYALDMPVDIEDTEQIEGPLASQRFRALCSDATFRGGELTLTDVLTEFDHRIDTAITLQGDLADAACRGLCPMVVRSVGLGARFVGDIVPGYPSTQTLARIRQHFGVAPLRTATMIGPETEAEARRKSEAVLLELPDNVDKLLEVKENHKEEIGKLDSWIDPIRLLNGLNFHQYLKSGRFFSKAMGAAHRFDHPHDPPRDPTGDPSRSTFQRAEARLDHVDMLLERRQFHADRMANVISGIYFYTDSSPVTGEELQGMVMDTVRKDRTYRRTTLPGATLSYGCFSAVQKTVTLLWVIFLVAGPTFEDMSYCLDHVWGITTDFGTEIRTLELPYILVAFLAWIDGRPLLECRPLVDYSRRLFYNAMRVIGWGHSWGNLMKAVCKACPQWPRVLANMQALVGFFKNLTWRKHCKK